MSKCTRDEAACALDCLKGKPFVAKYDAPIVKNIHNVEGSGEVCQKNCAIDYGKCMIQTFDMVTCAKQEACCALDCLKGGVKVQGLTHVEASAMETCQQNCGIETGKCLILTFDMEQCTKNEASCALDCLKGIAVQHNKNVNPSVKSIKCTACKFAAGKIQNIINKFGCGLADGAITAACEVAFGGPEDPLADLCAIGFISACPKLAKMIEQKTYTSDKACSIVHMC